MLHNQFQTLQIDITNRCNLQCEHCGRLYINKILDEPTLSEVRQIIKDARKIGFQEIVFSGGEPTLRNDLFEMIKIAKKENFFVSITTNGVFNDEALNNLINSKIDLIEISLDGLKNDHEHIRGVKNIFNRIINNLLKLNKKSKNIIVKITLHNKNYKKLEKFIKFLVSINVFNLNIRTVIPCGEKSDFWKENILSDFQIRDIIKQLSNKYNINIYSDNPRINLLIPQYINFINKEGNILDGSLIAGCLAGISNFYIDASLGVYPCSYLPMETGSLKKEKLDRIIKRIKKGGFFSREKIKGSCGSCVYKFICGGCRAIPYSSGNLYGEDFTCWKNKK